MPRYQTSDSEGEDEEAMQDDVGETGDGGDVATDSDPEDESPTGLPDRVTVNPAALGTPQHSLQAPVVLALPTPMDSSSSRPAAPVTTAQPQQQASPPQVAQQQQQSPLPAQQQQLQQSPPPQPPPQQQQSPPPLPPQHQSPPQHSPPPLSSQQHSPLPLPSSQQQQEYSSPQREHFSPPQASYYDDQFNAVAAARELEQSIEERVKASYEAQLEEQRQRYEQQLASRGRELAVATLKIQRLEQQAAAKAAQAKPVGALAKSGTDIKASSTPAGAGVDTEVSLLRREVEEQERLMQGYQQENEQAVRRLKELESALKEATTVRMPTAMMVHDDVLPPSRQHHLSTNREAAARLAEVLALQQQLESLRETSSLRESELKAQVERLRHDKKELEARKGGVDVQANQEGDLLVKQVRGEMESMRAQYQDMVSELQSKVRWYAENQELLTRQDGLVHQQQEVIGQLEKRLLEAEGPGARSASKRIADLTSQVASLQQTLRSRGLPKSLAAVIEAAKPGPAESGAVAALQAQVEQLTDKLADKDEEYERQLRTYQQQYEKLRLQFEERQASLQAQLKGRKKEGQMAAQLEEQRAMYTRQIRELKVKLQQSQALAAQPPPTRTSSSYAAGSDSQVPASLLRAKESEVTRLQQELQRKTKQVAEMHLKLGEAEARVVQLGRSTATHLAASLSASPIVRHRQSIPNHHNYQGQQQQQDHLQGMGRSHMPGWMTGAGAGGEVGRSQEMDNGGLVGALQQRNAALQQQVATLQQQVSALQQQVAEAQQQLAQGDTQGALVRSMAAEGQLRAREREQAAQQDAARWQERYEIASSELQTLRARVTALEAELSAARAHAAQVRVASPQAAEFAFLEQKLESMSREVAAREAKWHEVLEDTRQLYAMQADLASKKLEAGLATKNMELELLRGRVDDLLASAARWSGSKR